MQFWILSKLCSAGGVTIDVTDRLYSAIQAGSVNHRLVFYIQFPQVSSLAIKLINPATSYMHNLQTATYLQPVFVFQALQWFLTVNGAQLQQLHMQLGVKLDWRETIPTGTTVAELVIHPLLHSTPDSVSLLCSHMLGATSTGPLLFTNVWCLQTLLSPDVHPELPAFNMSCIQLVPTQLCYSHFHY
ncbi:hypothetical protein V8B97DRAFT_1915783 [Scleroderma yunnanense]